MAGILKAGGLVVSGVALLLLAGALAIFFVSQARLNASVSVPTDTVAIPTDVGAIRRGQHIAGAIALCGRCHGPTLNGGIVLDDRSARVVAPDLTRGGLGASLHNADYVRAIRYGVDASGRQLWSMPSDHYNVLSDADLGALVAYLTSLPPTTASWPPNAIHPLGRLLFVTGQLDLLPAERIDRSAPRPAPVSVGATATYGEYVTTIAGCAQCHGPGLAGGRVPGGPPASDLTPAGLGSWNEADFVRAMRTGRRPDGSAIETAMSWPYYAEMSDVELAAIWEFLGVIP
ncbi:MAG: c-type cytochrome [Chloroflexi bacterium]|nr:c-type cytochrome [Chloroflexota bacterium]